MQSTVNDAVVEYMRVNNVQCLTPRGTNVTNSSMEAQGQDTIDEEYAPKVLSD